MSPGGAARLALCALALGVLTVPSASQAQQPARVARIAILSPGVTQSVLIRADRAIK